MRGVAPVFCASHIFTDSSTNDGGAFCGADGCADISAIGCTNECTIQRAHICSNIHANDTFANIRAHCESNHHTHELAAYGRAHSGTHNCSPIKHANIHADVYSHTGSNGHANELTNTHDSRNNKNTNALPNDDLSNKHTDW